MKKYLFKVGFGAVAGGILGFAYYYFIGCNGSCPISGNPYISTAYGALAGIFVTFPSKIKDKENENTERN